VSKLHWKNGTSRHILITVKIKWCVTKHQGMEVYSHSFLTSVLQGRGQLTLPTHLPPLALTPFLLNRRLFELQAHIAGFGEKNKSLALTTVKPRTLGRPDCSPVPIPTEIIENKIACLKYNKISHYEIHLWTVTFIPSSCIPIS
jgi:hypothetical protein